MSRLAGCFGRLRNSGRTALVPYITAADPRPEDTVALMHTLVGAGADVVELGVPFSDPMADGPVIQAACERALAHGVTLRGVLDMVAEFRRRDAATPVVLMGYSNPIEAMGPQAFVEHAARAGVDGVITVDLPPEEAQAEGMLDALDRAGVDPVFLLAPTTSEERIRRICAVARGFMYYVSLKGVTGAGHLDSGDVAEHLAIIRRHTSLPVGVGFGIKDADSAAAVAAVADAVVVGSALVDVIARHSDNRGDNGSGDQREHNGNGAAAESCRAAAADFLVPIRAALEAGANLNRAAG